MTDSSIEDLAGEPRRKVAADPVSARLRVAMATPYSDAVLVFRVPKREAALVERVVESAAGGSLSRGAALARICREYEAMTKEQR